MLVTVVLTCILFVVTNACQVISSGGRQSKNRLHLRQINFFERGTKWCGSGNISDHYDDLGSEWQTDKCCRDHDFCQEYIGAGLTTYNLTNEGSYSRMSCECDEQFRECLRAAKKRTANNVGNVYFNLLGTKCFREDYPIVACVRRGGWLNRKCLEYTYNTTATKLYQWFDVIEY